MGISVTATQLHYCRLFAVVRSSTPPLKPTALSFNFYVHLSDSCGRCYSLALGSSFRASGEGSALPQRVSVLLHPLRILIPFWRLVILSLLADFPDELYATLSN